MIKKGDELLIDVLDLTSEGKGVSRVDDGFVVFSEGTLPGDRAMVRVSKKKNSYAEARTIEIVRKSDYRIQPACRFFGTCGGCKLQNLEYDKQIEFKTKIVKDAFERIGGFPVKEIPQALKCDEIFYYRNKMEYSFSDDEWFVNPDSKKNDAPGFALGLHVPKFHSKIISIDECFLQSQTSNGILNFTREFFTERNATSYSTKTQSGFLRFLILRQSKNTNDFMVNLITFDYDENLINEYSTILRSKFPDVTTLVNSISQKKSQVATGEEERVIFGSGLINEKLITADGREFTFSISPQSFFQTNTLQAQRLFNEVVRLGQFNESDNVLDLYCGTGSISIFISDFVGSVFGVELSDAAISDAKQNALVNNVKNAEFMCSDIKDFLVDEIGKNDKWPGTALHNKLILDPPRSGLHPKICETLAESKFEKIIYVSCNPHTQARDLKIICGNNNYRIDSMQPVDMFPHTYHIENVVSLVRN